MTEDRNKRAYELLLKGRDRAIAALDHSFQVSAAEIGFDMPAYGTQFTEDEPTDVRVVKPVTFTDVKFRDVFTLEPGMRYMRASKLLCSLTSMLVFDGHPEDSLVVQEGDCFQPGQLLYIYDQDFDPTDVPDVDTDEMLSPEAYFLSEIN